MNRLREEIRRKTKELKLLSIGFILSCIILPVIGAALIWLGFWIMIPVTNSMLDFSPYVRVPVFLFTFVFLLLPFLLTCLLSGLYLFSLVIYLLKSLCKRLRNLSAKSTTDHGPAEMEVTEMDCPELFALITETAKEVGAPMPEHVFLSATPFAMVNARSPYSYTLKNLHIGIVYFYGLNKSELKAILSHEMCHFLQRTGFIGFVSNHIKIWGDELLNIEERRSKAEFTTAARGTLAKRIALCTRPARYILRSLINLYWNINKRIGYLNRLVEFEADNAACLAAGSRAHISLLCKTDYLAGRWDVYKRVIGNLLSEGFFIEDFADGYRYCYDYFGESKEIKIDSTTIVEKPHEDHQTAESRIIMTDGWCVHPGILERIENAKKEEYAATEVNYEDASLLVSDETINKLGLMYQKQALQDMGVQRKWEELSPIQSEKFREGARDYIDVCFIPTFMVSFTNIPVQIWDLPNDEELEKEEITSPFTTENKNMVREYLTADQDWNTLMKIYNYPVNVDFSYNGNTNISINEAFELHKPYVESFLPRIKELEINIFKFLWSISEDKQRVKSIYNSCIYAVSIKNYIYPIYEEAENILGVLNTYRENGVNTTYKLKDQIRITEEFRKILQQIELDYISSCFGPIQIDNNTKIDQTIENWKKYLSANNVSFYDTIIIMRQVWHVMSIITDSAKEEKARLIIQYSCKSKRTD